MSPRDLTEEPVSVPPAHRAWGELHRLIVDPFGAVFCLSPSINNGMNDEHKGLRQSRPDRRRQRQKRANGYAHNLSRRRSRAQPCLTTYS